MKMKISSVIGNVPHVPALFPLCSRCSRLVPDVPALFPMFPMFPICSRCSRFVPDVPALFPMSPFCSRFVPALFPMFLFCSWCSRYVPDVPTLFPMFPLYLILEIAQRTVKCILQKSIFLWRCKNENFKRVYVGTPCLYETISSVVAPSNVFK